MNPVFKSKYDQMRESQQPEPTGDDADTESNGNLYAQAGHIRNLCFAWPDGKRQFLNYNYLVSGEYLPQRNIILLEFTTHKVQLVGIRLEKLYHSIMQQLILRIICVETRYNDLSGADLPIVNEINVEKE